VVPGVALLATLLVIGGPAPAVADCGMEAPPRYLSGYRGLAFIGTVDSRELVTTSSGIPQGFILTITVERPIAGSPAKEVRVFGGESGSSCNYFYAEALDVGDRVLMSFRPGRYTYVDLPEGVEAVGPALVWRPIGEGRWRFADRTAAFVDGYPSAARAARGLPAILAMVRPQTLPDTSTTPSRRTTVLDLMTRTAILVRGLFLT
jgi:hypothetical protein